MPTDSKTIVVAGDVTIDWFGVTIPPLDRPDDRATVSPLSWQLEPGTRMFAKPGGALLLCRMLRAATSARVVTHCLEQLDSIPPDEIVHCLVELGQFPSTSDKKDAKKLLYRVKRFGGFAGPADGTPKLLRLLDDDPHAHIVVLDDAGNGFRDASHVWPSAVTAKSADPIIVLKMSRPIAKGALWDVVHERHKGRTILVVSANDLRADGANISRRLSWEKTVTDLMWQLVSNPALIYLTNCRHLVVRLGIDGALHVEHTDGGMKARLHYDPAVTEDGFGDAYPGDMVGFNSAFVAGLTAHVATHGIDALPEGVPPALRAARRLLRCGFGKELGTLDYPVDELYGPSASSDEPSLAEVAVPLPVSPSGDSRSWSILRDIKGVNLEDLAYSIVVHGGERALPHVPVGRFRDLRTVDRTEIEGYRSVRNLIREYLLVAKPARPLSIAVFGPPGSGKSFGVTEVAESVTASTRDGLQIERLNFNLSQFLSPQQLVGALHKVRDSALAGCVPLVFFDEFDSTLETPLGWLKYLLAPMQDGVFNDGEALHLIGKAIFVFAGGTNDTYELFAELANDPKCRDAKGRDFVSRLRGYVNILGPNPSGEGDQFFPIRRAMMFRGLLERKAKHLIDRSERAQVDPGVLRAFIKVPKYEHGVRSMEAIIDMSMLAGRGAFEQAALPSLDQLKLHVDDAETFCRLVLRDILFRAAREKLASKIQEQFQKDQKSRPPTDPAIQPWETLAEAFKDSCRQQADHIPEKLRKIGCGFEPLKADGAAVEVFTDEEVEKLAEMEHDRWVAERRQSGWTLADDKDLAKKTSPYLVPWHDLTEEIRDYDRKIVRAIPALMKNAGFQVYRFD